jgi:excisionase family DNA binding protein
VQTEPIPVMTIAELSEYLRVPKSTLYKLAQEGKVPGQKVGRHWRFRKEAIDRWLELSIGRPSACRRSSSRSLRRRGKPSRAEARESSRTVVFRWLKWWYRLWRCDGTYEARQPGWFQPADKTGVA